MPLDNAGNTLNTARNINPTSSNQTFQDWVGTSDINDFYRFSLAGRSSLELSLDGLSNNANIELIRDSNKNGLVDKGEVISGSYKTGKQNELIQSTLDAGDYFVRVYAASRNSTNYNLKISAKLENIAPNSLNFQLDNTNLKTTDSLSINSGWVYDANGASDIAKIDFQIKKADGGLIDVADVINFSGDGSDKTKNNFSYSLSLADLKLGAGDYSLQAVAYDKAGTGSNLVAQKFTVIPAPPINIAPNSLNFQLDNTNLKTTDSLSINSGWVYDANGASDIAKIDFQIKKADGGLIDVVDVLNFSGDGSDKTKNNFSYSLSLADLNLGTGDYSLQAVAYDKAGTGSNLVERQFTIIPNPPAPSPIIPSPIIPSPIIPNPPAPNPPVSNDWFSQNLLDQQLVTLVQNLASDGDLSRRDMLDIFRSAEDESKIDGNEIKDLKTLLGTSTPFSMQDPVKWLSTQVANGAAQDMSANDFASNLVGRWFLGTVAPTPIFNGRNLGYTEVQGSLFGSANEARIGDIDQGYSLGDCPFLAALGATFGRQSDDKGNTSSSVINNMITDNGDNTYTVRFFSGTFFAPGEAQYVTVDHRLANISAQTQNGVLWVALVEKAYAQWREWITGSPGYDMIGNGSSLAAPLTYITGRQTISYGARQTSFSSIESALANGQAITTTRLGDNNNFIVASHAYSVTNVYINNSSEQRVVVRNPWGVDGLTISGANDGFIDLSFDEFIQGFNYGVSIA